jgi:hypothetical protein
MCVPKTQDGTSNVLANSPYYICIHREKEENMKIYDLS